MQHTHNRAACQMRWRRRSEEGTLLSQSIDRSKHRANARSKHATPSAVRQQAQVANTERRPVHIYARIPQTSFEDTGGLQGLTLGQGVCRLLQSVILFLSQGIRAHRHTFVTHVRTHTHVVSRAGKHPRQLRAQLGKAACTHARVHCCTQGLRFVAEGEGLLHMDATSMLFLHARRTSSSALPA